MELCVDKSAKSHMSGAKSVLITPKGNKLPYSLKFEFDNRPEFNNRDEYKANLNL